MWVEGSSWKVRRRSWQQQRGNMLRYAPWSSYSFTQLSITTVKVCTWTTSDTCHRETLYSGIAVLCYWVISENLDRATKLHQEANEASAGSLVTDFEQVQPARTHWIYIVWTAELNTLRPVDWGIQRTAENSGRHQTSQVRCTEDVSPFCGSAGSRRGRQSLFQAGGFFLLGALECCVSVFYDPVLHIRPSAFNLVFHWAPIVLFQLENCRVLGLKVFFMFIETDFFFFELTFISFVFEWFICIYGLMRSFSSVTKGKQLY